MSASPILTVVGKGINRVEGRAKVTGRANYAADNHFPGLVHAFGVFSTIASGRVASIDADEARGLPGVLGVWHHGNFPRLYRSPNDFASGTKVGEARPPFEDDVVYHAGQYIAVVVATTFEQARAAARLLRVRYTGERPPAVSLEVALAVHGERARDGDARRGDPETAWEAAPVKVDATYTTAPEVHHPLELHATVAVWKGDAVELHDSTQSINGERNGIAKMLGIPLDRVTVKAPYIGGGFGGKLFLWHQTVIAAALARELGRPVKLIVERRHQSTTVGHRPFTRQRLRLAADRNGKLLSVRHDTHALTSLVDDFMESCGNATRAFYDVANLGVTHRMVPANIGTPTAFRAPGAAPGLFALESAVDELAIALGVDPITFRLGNLPEQDPDKNLPWSSNHLRECFEVATARFGWSRRIPEPGSMRDGAEILGWGAAAASWGAHRGQCAARVELRADGTARVTCGTQDIGTGTYTVIAQVAAEITTLPIEKIFVVLGDTNLPQGPNSGGSQVTATVIPAVAEAARQALQSLFRVATRKDAPLAGRDIKKLAVRGGVVVSEEDGTLRATIPAILTGCRLASVDAEAKTAPGPDAQKYSFRCFGVHLAEVRWDPGIARLKVSRIVSVLDAGRIINAKTARNQIHGALIMGIGMTLFEESLYDPRSGRVVNDNFADYHIPSHADTADMDVVFLDHPDPHIGEFGARGIGELGITGIAAAIANAVHHATGKRIRDLPITVDKLLA
jgi:xanthine dehydrogenase YagR molybdenum-binding subunit